MLVTSSTTPSSASTAATWPSGASSATTVASSYSAGTRATGPASVCTTTSSPSVVHRPALAAGPRLGRAVQDVIRAAKAGPGRAGVDGQTRRDAQVGLCHLSKVDEGHVLDVELGPDQLDVRLER